MSRDVTPNRTRCTAALRLFSMSTRCIRGVGHLGPHMGRGLRENTTQRVVWEPGDRRQFVSIRPDQNAWEHDADGHA